MSYLRATDPFPLEAADFTKLHEFYTRLGQGRLCTTRCARCRRTAWPPRGFCAECGSDEFAWADLPAEGVARTLAAVLWVRHEAGASHYLGRSELPAANLVPSGAKSSA